MEGDVNHHSGTGTSHSHPGIHSEDFGSCVIVSYNDGVGSALHPPFSPKDPRGCPIICKRVEETHILAIKSDPSQRLVIRVRSLKVNAGA